MLVFQNRFKGHQQLCFAIEQGLEDYKLAQVKNPVLSLAPRSEGDRKRQKPRAHEVKG